MSDEELIKETMMLDYSQLVMHNVYMIKENKRLHSIIEEVREYIMTELITEWDIENGGHVSGSDLPVEAITPILDILDKGSDKE